MNTDSSRPTSTDSEVDLAWYAARFPDVALSGLAPDDHWRRIGRRLGRPGRPTALAPSAATEADRGTSATDHALVVHVWHLDVLDELAEAAAHLPYQIDQFVTLPTQFGKAERDRIAAAFPRARQVVVENAGQDVGALFQLMKQVDLDRYSFLCKIHTKKGPSMPNEWRRALLDGVLGSERQVRHIIDRFRADPQMTLAGARQLYLHGPSYICENAEGMKKTFGGMIGDFSFLKCNWGFIAGTFFWIRTSILIDLAQRGLGFQPGSYVSDGTLAHATERMFGLAVALRGGKVLLQDLTLPDRLPDEESEFPSTLPRKSISLLKILSPLAANMFLRQPGLPKAKDALAAETRSRTRVAVFASYSSDGVLPPQVAPYLDGLSKIAGTIVVVCDNDLLPDEAAKLRRMATHVITGRHGEYDFGSYKRGIIWANEAGHLNSADELILCNDSCFGPIRSFEPMFREMDTRGHDFWGVTDSHQFSHHLQSYFLVFSNQVFRSSAFMDFFSGVKKLANVQEVILNYELGLSKTLVADGFKFGALVDNNFHFSHPNEQTYANLPILPFYTISRGSPLLKTKAVKFPHTNVDGPNRTLRWLKEQDSLLYEAVVSDPDTRRFELASEVSFSIILPTRNRAYCIERALRSILSQSHENFELIIVDDHSTDNTFELVHSKFHDQILDGKFRYIKLESNLGVCAARNIGIAYSRNPWIAYVDSDNEVRPYMLSMFANTIVQHPNAEAFYSKVFNHNAGVEIGSPFDHAKLVSQNFIDLGAYVHAKSLVHKYGAFDDKLRRLVDWDMIIRHTKDKSPVFIMRVCLDYDDNKEITDRISVKESVVKALAAVWAKHSPKPTVSTVIVSYNHEDFIKQAIDSALAQKGDFNHEIVLADDGSTDRTPDIIAKYVAKYPFKIRSIGRGGNFGISENYRHAFAEAEGRFIAILEGDDYWTDTEKLVKQAAFLSQNRDATMVMSRIELLDMTTNARRLLKRQEGLPNLLSAKYFADNEHLNLIVNLSCCMFRSEIMKRLPEDLYHPRLSEIALAFYLDRLGSIGFIPDVMSTYRLNSQSVWTGADVSSKHQQAIAVREAALRMARPIYRATIQSHIDQRRRMLEAERARSRVRT